MASSGGSLEKAFFAKLDKVDSSKGSVFHFQFNPKDFKVAMGAEWKEDDSHGTKGKPKPFVSYSKGKAGILTMEIIFDTTDTPSENVHTKYIEPLTDLLRPQFKDPPAKKDALPRSRPPFCMFGWGTLEFRGVITKLDVTYLLFKSDGSPLRAKVIVAMTEQPVYGTDMSVAKGENDPLKALVSAKTSAVKRTDPTKIEGHSKVIEYTAKPGDTVSSIAEETGASAADIAEANNLDDLTDIAPGTVFAIPFGPAAAAAMSVIADIEKTAGKWAEAAAGAAAELAEEALEAVASLFEEEAAALAVVGVIFTSAAVTVMAGAGNTGKSKAGGGGKAGKGKAKSKAKKAEYKRNDKAAEEAEEGAKGADFKAKEFDEHEAGDAADFEAKAFDKHESGKGAAKGDAKKAEYSRSDKAAEEAEEGAKGADFKAKEFDEHESGKGAAKGEAKKAEYSRDDKEAKAGAEGAKGADFKAKEFEKSDAGKGAEFKAKETDAPEAGKASGGGEAKKAEYSRDDKAPEKSAEGAKGAAKAEAKAGSDAKAGAGKSGESKSSSDASAGKGAGGGSPKSAPPAAATDARSQLEKDLAAKVEGTAKGEANAAKTEAVTAAKGAVRETVGVDEHGQKVGGDGNGNGGGKSAGEAGGKSAGEAGGKSGGEAGGKPAGEAGGKASGGPPKGDGANRGGSKAAGGSAPPAKAGAAPSGAAPSGAAPSGGSSARTAGGAPSGGGSGGGGAPPKTAAADAVAKAVEEVKDTIEDA